MAERPISEDNVSLRSDEGMRRAGAVGVWTKADSLTAFDDFSFGGTPPR